MSSTPTARSQRGSFSSSILSDPPSDIDEQESPFPPSPKKRRNRTISRAIAHAIIRGNDESLLVGDETPQQTWQRRYGNAPLQPRQDDKQVEQASPREMINKVEDMLRKEVACLKKQLAEKNKMIGELQQRISYLEDQNAKLLRSSEKSADASKLGSNENMGGKLKVKAKASR